MQIFFQHEGPYSPEKVFKFSGGEVQVVLGDELSAAVQGNQRATVMAKLRNSDDIMTLLLFTDAIKRVKPSIKMNLLIPYLPYGRQDRVCAPGEALSVRVMADVINTMGYDEVIVHDPHSDVGIACLNGGTSWPVENIIDNFYDEEQGKLNQKVEGMHLIAPDAGAMKKVQNVAKFFSNKLPVINCSKERDVKTGNITGTYVNWGYSMRGFDLLIVDDICDGGMTFIKIAEALQKFKPTSISLYVTHGIFSKGKGVLFDAGINTIYTTDSFPNETIGLEGKLFVQTL